MKIKKIITTVLLTTIFATTAYAAIPEYGAEYKNQPTKTYTQKFNDVKNNHWAFDYISEMVERGILSGYPNGYFYPNNTITRAEFAKVMCLAAGLNVSSNVDSSYLDVKDNDWFLPYVETGKYYLSGYINNGDKYYKPNENALREDIAVALVKLKGYDTSLYDESILKTMFTDYQSISSGARKYVSIAVENELISGYEDNTFRGQDTITRAEAATLLWRAYQFGNDNKVFEHEEFDEPVIEIQTTTKPVAPTPIPTIKPTETPTPTVEPTETSAPVIEEKEYTHEVTTICNKPGHIYNMVATDNGVYYPGNEGIVFVSNDGDKKIVLDSKNIEQLSDAELTKAEKANMHHYIRGFGINPSNNHAYTIIEEYANGAYYYLYDLSTQKVIKELDKKENGRYYGPVGMINTCSEDLKISDKFYFDEFENLFVPYDGDLYLYDYNKFEFVYPYKIDYYIKNLDDFFNVNSNYFYALDNDFNFYRISVDGDDTLILSENDINIKDRKKLDRSHFTGVGEGRRNRYTTAVSDNEEIYFYDYTYDCIRMISKIK